MADLAWNSNAKMVSSPNNKSPKLDKQHHLSLPTLPLPLRPTDISAAASPLCSAYDHYLRLPELRKLWTSKEFPNWSSESIFKPALHALEITFRFISLVLSDPRPYANRREWIRRIESLATSEIEMIAMLCEDEEEDPTTRGRAPVADLSKGESSRSYSEASLLPRLATWYKSKDVAQRILCSVEYNMMRCPYTLGLGEPNLSGKPSLRYDDVCKPNEIHALAITTPFDHIDNYENQTVYTTHQIVESWIRVTHQLLERLTERIESKRLEEAKNDCYAVERIWKLLTDIEDLHMLMDPADFLMLKNQLSIKSTAGETAAFCFRSTELVEVTKMCKDLKQKVPGILEVEVDPQGGPRIQEAAMRLYVDKRNGMERVHVLQGMQGIEAAMKRFFYAYKQVVGVVMGSFEANGNRVGLSWERSDSLSQIFLEPTYYPSLDAAKTFLGYFWGNDSDRQGRC
ncbi:nematode resistance protein-like HSPRO2 [Senna tora]|uniref:Nematode resistance protein-like HSPRO2 n=1 Tax=Senna tora TaxID=362788 RepID=A0A834T6Q4_9FABA|nr:nematode resistance protein-like HSPRO2 [Senna tora]